MNDRSVGWAFVGAQFALLAVIILTPGGEAWELPTGMLWATRTVVWLSIALMAVAAVGLGRGLTPVPIPNDHAQLRTGGLYRFVRHPIYSGLLLFAIAMAIKSGSLVVSLAAPLLIGLINVKARWEERRMIKRFDGYSSYAERTPRFIPTPKLRV